MGNELRPCPVCGSVAELKEAYYLESDEPYSYVHCTNRNCVLNHNTPHFTGDTEAKNSENAIAAWNQRVETQA
jgi:hypothetical protein